MPTTISKLFNCCRSYPQHFRRQLLVHQLRPTIQAFPNFRYTPTVTKIWKMTPSSDPTKTMPAVETMRASAVPLPSFKPIIERTSHLPKREGAIKFEASKHLEFSPPSRVVTMKEIGYKEDAGVSPVAVSEPFKLFSREAIQQMRAEIMQPEVMEKCKFKSNIAASQLRGYAPK